MEIYKIVETMMVLFSIILIGYYITKKNMLDKNTSGKLSALVINVTTPALIINSVSNKGNSLIDKKEIILIFIIGLALYGFLIGFSKLVVRLLNFKDDNSSIYELLLIFSNTGFIGYPIVRVVFGEGSIFPFSILHLPFNALLFSYGVYSLRKGEIKRGLKIKDIMNPGVIASFIALFIFLFEIKMPNIVVDISRTLGDSTIPLSMLLIGSSLSFIPLRSIFTEKKTYIIAGLKLLVFPLVIYYLSNIIITNDIIKGFLVLSVALPTGATVSMLTSKYEINEEIGSLGVFITTLLSIITMPIIISLLII